MEEKNKKQLLDEEDLEDVNGGNDLSAGFFSCRIEKNATDLLFARVNAPGR